jgi:hypothetical protein
MDFAHALHEWSDFYLLVGTAGATLVALLFVAVSLGAGFLTQDRAAATQAFFSPVVVHFAAVFVISALALVPSHSATFFAALIVICAGFGVAVSAFTCVQLLRNRWTDYLQDHLGYGLLPLAGYVALIAAAALIYTEHAAALDVLAGALLVLLVTNIRNAWDLTLSMVRRQSGGKSEIDRGPPQA